MAIIAMFTYIPRLISPQLYMPPLHLCTAVIENIVHPLGHPVRSYLVLKFRLLCVLYSILPDAPDWTRVCTDQVWTYE